MDRPRVLVVEDNPGVLRLMATVLESAYQVSTAPDGPTALGIIDSAPVDVVLADVRMPGLTGFDVLKEARRRAPAIQVVVMTAYANVPDAVAAIKLGAFDYVAKPLDADEISLVVARAVEHRRGNGDPGRPAAPAECKPDNGEEGCQEVSVEFRRAIEEARDRASRDYLVNLLRSFHGNVTNAAKRAGMTRESLHRVLRKYGVRSEPFKGHPVGGESLAPGVDSGQ
ncbi:MAG TPA: response regulator [Anaeromyxobacteraceae bacterium]|nr:response regulator [Anaeromyxobacteraceae bacterium]